MLRKKCHVRVLFLAEIERRVRTRFELELLSILHTIIIMARLPLCDIPLDRFMPAYDPANIFATHSSLKRPLSPDGRQETPTAKRRATLKDQSMASPRSSKVASSSRYGQRSVDFDAILRGPNSPARRLDFSSPPKSTHCQDAMDVTPRPRTRAAARAQASIVPDLLQQQPEASSSRSNGSGTMPAQPHHHPIAFNLVPRPLPPLQESTSEHFPGFYVCPDPYIVEACVDDMQVVEEPIWYDEEPDKENNKPPREIHNLSTLSLDSPTKPTSGFSMSVAKNKPHTASYVSFAHRRIFGVHSGLMEDALDLGASDSFARRAALASDLLCLERDNIRAG